MHYHARDMAVVRARIADIPIVLSSATPSVETVVNARRGRYRRLALAERFGGQHLPAIEPIDLKREGPPRGRFIAPRLAGAVKTALERGEQALLFLNRRGYAPLTLCRACGFRFNCPNCDAWLVEHRFKRQLVCHHCGFATPPPPPARNATRRIRSWPAAPASSGWRKRSPRCSPSERVLVLSSDLVDLDRADARGIPRDRGGPRRHRDRHATRRQGTSLPAPQSRRRRRCGPGARLGRPARRGAHIPAAASGDRPRRARGGLRRRLSADPSARASGDEGADRAGSRGVLQFRDRGARELRLSAVRAAREPARHRRRQARDGRLRAQARGRRSDRPTT